jgi:hypothetical protein
MRFVKLIGIVGIATILNHGAVFAQEKTNSVSPVIEFGGGSTSFGIKAKIGVASNFSLRPLILFGYKPSVNRSDILRFMASGGTTQDVIDSDPIVGQDVISSTTRSIGTGIGYGLAATYDFKSPDNKLVVYIGPRILFGSASGNATTIQGVGLNVRTSETNIGLTAGSDYTISDDLTAGLNATYNLSRSGTISGVDTNPVTGNTSISGTTFNFAINIAYNF